MRRHLAWPIALPLAVIGSLAGHSIGYRAALPAAHERESVLASSGHGWLAVRTADRRPLLRRRRAGVRRRRDQSRAQPERAAEAGRRDPAAARSWRRSSWSGTCTTATSAGGSSCRCRSCSAWPHRCRSRCSQPRSPLRSARQPSGSRRRFAPESGHALRRSTSAASRRRRSPSSPRARARVRGPRPARHARYLTFVRAALCRLLRRARKELGHHPIADMSRVWGAGGCGGLRVCVGRPAVGVRAREP